MLVARVTVVTASSVRSQFLSPRVLVFEKERKGNVRKGVNCSFSFCPRCLGQNKWNIWITPPPMSTMPKWRVFVPSRPHGPDDWNCGRCVKWLIFRLGPQGLGQILVVSEYKIYCVALILCHE